MTATTRLQTGSSGDAAPAWRTAIDRVLHDGAALTMVYQPIVDVARRSVVGYESLARFSGPPDASPDRWFSAAAQLGYAPRLEAAALRRALAARHALPVNCFITVNLDPNLLLSEEVSATLRQEGALDNVIVEFTEHVPVEDYRSLSTAIDDLRSAGAKVAIDDTGSGYAGLSHVLALRPELLKLDRELVANIDRDPAKAALVEMLGAFASRIDAWILAEGVERPEELDRLEMLDVPLAQGYFLGRPAPPWSRLAGPADRPAQRPRRRSSDTSVAACVEAAPTVSLGATDARWFTQDPELDVVVELDAWQRPRVLRLRNGTMVEPQRTTSSTPLVEALDRALARGTDQRFTPIVCCDDLGRFIGVVRIDRATAHLLRTLRAAPTT